MKGFIWQTFASMVAVIERNKGNKAEDMLDLAVALVKDWDKLIARVVDLDMPVLADKLVLEEVVAVVDMEQARSHQNNPLDGHNHLIHRKSCHTSFHR